ncbi:MAG: class I SAM-dependent methyltransferase [Sphingobacteriales bacterium]|nr:MAG: class I SAM-dependent methyltransferase [Sphingobacteriales bacterium]TAF81762.1 MAG: class I SAM-dependent methyltransferase [Sphingobacteriales bacterium]
MQKNWYKTWFNSPFYHLLYNARNTTEAEFFIDNLCAFLHPPINAKIIDIACGKGRHAVYLNKKGFEVIGTDLSYASISFAKTFENSKLQFFVQDMRSLFYINYFDFAFNLFTSFGYFDTHADHVKALKSFAKSLNKNGLLVLDYMNAEKIAQNLVTNEVKTINDITFTIERKIADGKIIKNIHFTALQNDYAFSEEVSDFRLADFTNLFYAAGLQICHTFGDYSLNPFVASQSDRLIFICKKTEC